MAKPKVFKLIMDTLKTLMDHRDSDLGILHGQLVREEQALASRFEYFRSAYLAHERHLRAVRRVIAQIEGKYPELRGEEQEDVCSVTPEEIDALRRQGHIRNIRELAKALRGKYSHLNVTSDDLPR